MAEAKKTSRKKVTKKTTKKTAVRKKAPASKRAASGGATARTATAAAAAGPAARRFAEFLGMDPDEVQATADKLREQTRAASERVRLEVGRLAERTEQLSAKLDAGFKDGVEKVEQIADQVIRSLSVEKDGLQQKLEQRLDQVGKEASRLADSASVEVKKVYEQAKLRLNEIFSKRRS